MASSVRTYALTLAPLDLKWMRRNAGTQRCFPGQLQVGERQWDVWIGYRGRYSRHFRKRGYDIWFDPHDSFDGHTALHLNAAYRDPSSLRSRLALSLFADLNVPTPNAWHLWLTLNGEPLGLYTAAESLNAPWLERRGLVADSIYYGVGNQGTFGLLDPETNEKKRSLARGYEKCYPDDDNFIDLETLIYSITLPTDEVFAKNIDLTVDAEECLRWLIGLEFLSHTDGLVQNYALFRTEGERWQLSPWDCDGTLGRIPNGRRYAADGMDVGSGEDNYLLARLLRSPRWRKRYLALWGEALRGPLRAEAVGERLEVIFREIRPDALADTNKRRSDTTFLREPALIRQYLNERTTFVRDRLGERRVQWRSG